MNWEGRISQLCSGDGDRPRGATDEEETRVKGVDIKMKSKDQIGGVTNPNICEKCSEHVPDALGRESKKDRKLNEERRGSPDRHPKREGSTVKEKRKRAKAANHIPPFLPLFTSHIWGRGGREMERGQIRGTRGKRCLWGNSSECGIARTAKTCVKG